MRVGTPEFKAERLNEAREARGLTQTALAEITGLRVQSISQYELGKQTPSPEALSRLCQALGQSELYFQKQLPSYCSSAVKCRSLSSATKTARIRAERKLSWQKEIYDILSEYVDFPGVNIPIFEMPTDPHEITTSRIEEVAIELRSFWKLGLGPIDNVVQTMENNGVIVTRIALEAETLDALSQWDEVLQRPFVVLGSDKRSAARSRFDAAHELAHIVLHRYHGEKYIRKSATFKLMEAQAHRFAAAFLLPEASFANELWAPTLDAFASLKKHWKVSIATMISRCNQLGLASEEQTRRLWINLSRKGWRVIEPFDSTTDPEIPRLFSHTFKLIFDAGVADRHSLQQDIAINVNDVEALSCVARGYLSGVSAAIDPAISIKQRGESTGRLLTFRN